MLNVSVSGRMSQSLDCFTFLDLNPLVLQHFTELLNLFFELSNELRICVLIDNSFAHNLLRSVSVSVAIREKEII